MRRKLILILLALLVLAGVPAGIWAGWWWAHYPKAPNVKTTDPNESIAYMGGDDFNRLTHADRVRFALAVVERMKEKTFPELVGQMMVRDERRKQISENIKKLDKDERDKIGSAFMQLFLNKYYEESDSARNTYLTTVVLLQKSGGATGRMKEMGIPKPDDFKKAVGDFITRQPPHAQAQMSQFMLDLSKKQEAMGMRPGG